MTSGHLLTGKTGEKEGVSYLKRVGYEILETNFKSPFGEIDCITKSKGFIVFVEIKTRRQTAFGLPEEAVGAKKQRKIAQIAEWYLKLNHKLDAKVRFDVLSIFVQPSGSFEFHLIENAFEAV